MSPPPWQPDLVSIFYIQSPCILRFISHMRSGSRLMSEGFFWSWNPATGHRRPAGGEQEGMITACWIPLQE